MSTPENIRVPRPIGGPVLESVLPVIARSRHVRTRISRIVEQARALAGEEFPFPNFAAPYGLGDDSDLVAEFLLVGGLIDFAFTDFSTGVKFTCEYRGREWSDAEAMFACLKRALDSGTPVLDGAWMARVTRKELERIFRGKIEMPMLDERVEIFRQAGQVLCMRHGGRFRNFLRAGAPCVYSGGRGLLERLVEEFPRFRDVSRYQDHEVKFYKLAQLALWTLHASLAGSGAFRLEDADTLTAFADYVLPLALRQMGIPEYSPPLAEAVAAGRLLARDSEEEIEIRAHTIYATALLTEELNALRPRERQLIIPQLDAFLWTHYHTSPLPHHLTRTIMY
jgi:hypothetical protein